MMGAWTFGLDNLSAEEVDYLLTAVMFAVVSGPHAEEFGYPADLVDVQRQLLRSTEMRLGRERMGKLLDKLSFLSRAVGKSQLGWMPGEAEMKDFTQALMSLDPNRVPTQARRWLTLLRKLNEIPKEDK